jgi:hypothetical protein
MVAYKRQSIKVRTSRITYLLGLCVGIGILLALFRGRLGLLRVIGILHFHVGVSGLGLALSLLGLLRGLGGLLLSLLLSFLGLDLSLFLLNGCLVFVQQLLEVLEIVVLGCDFVGVDQ